MAPLRWSMLAFTLHIQSFETGLIPKQSNAFGKYLNIEIPCYCVVLIHPYLVFLYCLYIRCCFLSSGLRRELVARPAILNHKEINNSIYEESLKLCMLLKKIKELLSP